MRKDILFLSTAAGIFKLWKFFTAKFSSLSRPTNLTFSPPRKKVSSARSTGNLPKRVKSLLPPLKIWLTQAILKIQLFEQATKAGNVFISGAIFSPSSIYYILAWWSTRNTDSATPFFPEKRCPLLEREKLRLMLFFVRGGRLFG